GRKWHSGRSPDTTLFRSLNGSEKNTERWGRQALVLTDTNVMRSPERRSHQHWLLRIAIWRPGRPGILHSEHWQSAIMNSLRMLRKGIFGAGRGWACIRLHGTGEQISTRNPLLSRT